MKYTSSLIPKLIYVMRINDSAHKDCLKIGDATVDCEESTSELPPNCKILNQAAKERINSYTQTAGISYDLLYTELTVYFTGKGIVSFRDHDVHEVLLRSGIKKKLFNKEAKADEWFITDLATVKKAIAAVKAGKKSLNASDVTVDQSPVVFRPEQQDAINKTVKQFAHNNQMLWNAKMRFGKTLSALQVVKQMEFTRTLILTHRPVVNEGWFEDFQKIFYDRDDFAFGSRKKGDSFETLEKDVKKHHIHYVYFASIQDLRGSERTGGKFNKNDEIFDADWDLLIVDEAHEGTQTELGKNVMAELEKEDTKVLRLSGTPFNLLNDFKDEEIYTWDYVMEQKAKADWDKLHKGDPNPYAPLPKLNIFTFDLGKMMAEFRDEDLAFNFHEFFRVNDGGTFIHEKDVKYFLNLICQQDKSSNYPYSTEEYRDNFRHSLWMVPGVKEAKALSAILKAHKVFGQFQIVNVAGQGDEDEENEDALKMVQSAIGKNPDETYTITLSCGRLTTGVSIPAWTAVFMLSGSFNTSASSYMQTIFRVQTPATINGRDKTECFVFDFAPDRTLKVLAETAKISTKAGKTSGNDRQIMGDFLNFCPVIAVNGTQMRPYNVENMLERLKTVYVERVVRRGFEDNYLYNNDLLMKLTGQDLSDFDDLKKIIGTTKAMPKTGEIEINKQGFTDEEYEKLGEAEKKKKEELTKAEKKLLEEKKEKKKQRDTAISILRGISIRMPLMIYGAELSDESQEITIDNFANLIDQQSWEEFMPRGVSKQKFNAFKKYYEPDVFRAAGKQIRAMAKSADNEPLEERIALITNIFNTFRNPDKETVLTPWRVVNMHISDCIGGYCFYNEAFDTVLADPEFVDNEKVTADVFKPDSRILEINSKSGLYPLYMAYSIYRTRLDAINALGFSMEPSVEQQYELWDKVLAENIFVICKTPMAKSITKRTLLGFRKGKVHAHYFEDLVNMLKNKPKQFIERVTKKNYWGLKGNDKMEFDAVVGNPPYQVMDGGNKASATSIYNDFVTQSKFLNTKYISMIIPARWYSGGKGLDQFRNEMLADHRIETIVDFTDSRDCFPTVDIAGGVCYFLWNSHYKGKCRFININQGVETVSNKYLNEFDTLLRYPVSETIIKKVIIDDKKLSDIVSTRKPFGLDTAIKPLNSGDLKLRYNGGTGYFSSSKISVGKELIDVWKVIISYLTAEHAGQPDKNGQFRVLSTMELLPPKSVCSETYLVVGSFKTKEYAQNLFSYLQTRFVRFLIAQIAVSQHITKSCFSFVPTQDFTKKSDIDWSKSVHQIDLQLYKKYGLNKEEVSFIESMIKPMGEKDNRYYMTARSCNAVMEIRKDGYYVLPDSEGNIELAPSGKTSKEVKKDRKLLTEQSITEERDGKLVFVKEYRFNSPSAAASAIAGMPMNGKDIWKDAGGNTLNDLEDKK